jgi:hypothetical protein
MSSLELFQQQTTQLIKTIVLTPLVEWLQKEKSVSTTVDELVQVLNLPKPSVPVPTVPVPFPTVPVPNPVQRTLTSLVVPSSTPASGAKSKPKSKPSIPENYSGPTCKYVFKRGEAKGTTCGKPSINGGDYCEQCNAKKTTTKATTETKAPAKPVEPKPSVGFTTSISKRSEKPKIELRELNGQANTFVDTQTNIVVKKVSENEKTVYVAIGIQEDSGFRTLTEEEKKEALSRSFTLQNESSKQSEVKPSEKATETKATEKPSETNATEEATKEETTKVAEVKKSVPAVSTRLPVTPIPDIDDE